MIAPEDLLYVGFVSKVHGFRGEVTVALEDFPKKVKKPKFLFFLLDGGHVPFLVESFQLTGEMAYAKFEDVKSEKDAQKLVGISVFIENNFPASAKAAPSASQEIKGFSVVDKTAGEIGFAEDLQELPHQVLLIVRNKEKEILIPFSKPILQKIDRKAKIIYVDLPEGLLEVYH